MTRRLAVVVHDLPQAEAVLALEAAHGVAVTLVSAPGAARYAGIGFIRAMEDRLGRAVVADCGEDAGLVMAGLRAGLRGFLFAGPAETRARLADMAEQVGGRVMPSLDLPELHLMPRQAPASAVRARGPTEA